MFTIDQSTVAGILVLDIASDKSNEHPRSSTMADDLYDLIAESRCPQVLLDLQGIPFIRSDVIGQLIMLHKKCQANQRQLKVCGVSDQNQTALQLVHFDRLVKTYKRKANAIAAFKIDAQKPIKFDVDDGSASEYAKRAEAGDLDSQFRYGKCLETGHGVTQDFQAALKWYENAAKREHAESQHALAIAYAYGMGVPQDIEEAFRWYHLAAERGHAEAQYMIGMSLQYGLMDEVDLQRALKWYSEAAEQGYQPAQEAIVEIKRDR